MIPLPSKILKEEDQEEDEKEKNDEGDDTRGQKRRQKQDTGRFRIGSRRRRLFGLFLFRFYLLKVIKEKQKSEQNSLIIHKGVEIDMRNVWNLMFEPLHVHYR